MKRLSTCSLIAFSLFLSIVHKSEAQNRPPEHVQQAVEAIEQMITGSSETAISAFVNESILPSQKVDRDNLINRLKKNKAELQNRWQNVAIRPDPEGVRLIFSEEKPIRHLKVILDAKGIYDLHFAEAPLTITFTKNNIDSVFTQLENRDLSGLAYFKIDGEILYKQGFGMANRNLGTPNKPTSIFGVGSRPIDFTRAAIYLLQQQGKINSDDTIDQYFENVPKAKRSITITHLMTGQSGLPDFFDTPEDWDPDLAWIDKETAINRILNQDLLFAPGSDQQHSHAAFGLLAALIEEVSGQQYVEFLNQHFFEPAGMHHTNEYGVAGNHQLSDFAVGYGPQSVGLPNIPPNWGPTSWLIKGSGGMYSTLGDLLKFYEFIRSGQILNADYIKNFEQPIANLDGSMRGFELFNAYNPNGNEAYIFLNNKGDQWQMRALIDAAATFIL